MKKNSKTQFKGEYTCPDCGFHGLVKKAKTFNTGGGTLTLCETCYRLRTAPTTEDILRRVIQAKELAGTRHRFLWFQQIKRNKHNTSNIGSPATASIRAVEEMLEAVITGLLLHDKISPSQKKTHRK